MRSSRTPFSLAAASVALTLIAPASLSAQEPVTLEWKWRAGDEYLYRVATLAESQMPFGDLTQELAWLYRHLVQDVDEEGVARVSMTYQRMQFLGEGPAGRKVFDSATDNPSDDPEIGSLAALIGVSFNYRMRPNGKIEEVTGSEAIPEAILERMKEDMDPNELAEVREQLMASPSDEAMMILQNFQTLPDGPIEPGSTWEAELELLMGMFDMIGNFAYRLESVEPRDGRRIARVAFDGTMKAEPNSPLAAMKTMKIEDTTVTGSYDFDLDAGVMVESNTTTVSRMTSAGTGPAGMTTTTTVLLELVEGASSRGH